MLSIFKGDQGFNQEESLNALWCDSFGHISHQPEAQLNKLKNKQVYFLLHTLDVRHSSHHADYNDEKKNGGC